MNIYFFSCRTILTVFCTIYLLIFADIYPAQANDNNIVKLIRVEGWEEVNKFRLDGLKSLVQFSQHHSGISLHIFMRFVFNFGFNT